MHEIDVAWPRLESPDPIDYLGLVGMGAEAVEPPHLGLPLHRLTEDVHDLSAVDEAPAERSLGLEADEQHQIARIAEAVLQVVENASALAHARRGDHDDGFAHLVERARFVGRARVAQSCESQRLPVVLKEAPAGRFVEQLGVTTKHGRGLRGEGAVDVDRQIRDRAPLHQVVQRRHQLLRPAHGERRHDQPTAPLDRARHAFDEPAFGLGRGRVETVAVRALHDERIHAGRRLGIREDRPPGAAEIAAHAEPEAARPIAELERRERRPQDVPGVEILDRDTRCEIPRLVVATGREPLERRAGVLGRVERLERTALSLPGSRVRVRVTSQVLEVALHQECTVREHRATQIRGGWRCMDPAPEAVAHERRQIAAVIQVRV